jgi:hypothetical protein
MYIWQCLHLTKLPSEAGRIYVYRDLFEVPLTSSSQGRRSMERTRVFHRSCTAAIQLI